MKVDSHSLFLVLLGNNPLIIRFMRILLIIKSIQLINSVCAVWTTLRNHLSLDFIVVWNQRCWAGFLYHQTLIRGWLIWKRFRLIWLESTLRVWELQRLVRVYILSRVSTLGDLAVRTLNKIDFTLESIIIQVGVVNPVTLILTE